MTEVQEFLLQEGYAQTEEDARVLELHMSEEWKNAVLEARKGGYNADRPSTKAVTTASGEKVYPNTGGRSISKIERGLKKNHPQSQHKRLNPSGKKGKYSAKLDKYHSRFD